MVGISVLPMMSVTVPICEYVIAPATSLMRVSEKESHDTSIYNPNSIQRVYIILHIDKYVWSTMRKCPSDIIALLGDKKMLFLNRSVFDVISLYVSIFRCYSMDGHHIRDFSENTILPEVSNFSYL